MIVKKLFREGCIYLKCDNLLPVRSKCIISIKYKNSPLSQYTDVLSPFIPNTIYIMFVMVSKFPPVKGRIGPSKRPVSNKL